MEYSNRFLSLPQSIQDLIRLVVNRVHPKSIVLFGSRATGQFRKNSDFDLAVIEKGCSDTEWAKLLAEIAENLVTLHPVDLVEFENLSEVYKQNIRKKGWVLYE